MAKHFITLSNKELVAKDTMLFEFEAPKDFEFRAGQTGYFTLIEPSETDEKGNSRTFSFVHSPSEEKLTIATRLRDSAFKRVLKELPVGSEVKFNAPFGNFTLHNNKTKPAVFLIGGIGITPIRCMIAEATYNKVPHQLTLLYSNRTPDDAPFHDELEQLATENNFFNYVPVMTKANQTEWSGEHGHIDEAMLKRHVPDIHAPIYYLAGPAHMVQAMFKMLVDAGVDEDNIRAEEYSGY